MDVAKVSRDAERSAVAVALQAADHHGLVNHAQAARGNIDLEGIDRERERQGRREVRLGAHSREPLKIFVQTAFHGLQLGEGVAQAGDGWMRGAGLFAGVRCGIGPGAGKGVGSHPQPDAAPQEVRGGDHGVRRDVRKLLGHDLFGRRLGLDAPTAAAGPAHAHRIPNPNRLQHALILAHHYKHLVGGGRVEGPPRRHEQGVGLLAVGNDRGVFRQVQGSAADLHGAVAVPQISAHACLGRRRGEEQLVTRGARGELFVPRALAGAVQEVGHADLVHGVDHAGRAAGAGERRANF